MSAHASDEIREDEMGFLVGSCLCGWESPPCPDNETLTDWLMQHAYEAAILEKAAR